MTKFVTQGTDRIDVGEGEFVDIKRKMSLGDYDHIECVTLRDEVGSTMALLETNIVAWNLKDETDKELPVTRENIGRLGDEIALKLVIEIGKRNPRVKLKKAQAST